MINVDATPNSKTDAVPAIQAAIAQAAKTNGPVIIRFQPGQYELFRNKATKVPYHISNTTSEQENSDSTKTFPIYLKGMRHVRIDGQGAHLMLHGKMTPFGMDSCEDVKLVNLQFDMADPTVVEFKVTNVNGTCADVTISNNKIDHSYPAKIDYQTLLGQMGR